MFHHPKKAVQKPVKSLDHLTHTINADEFLSKDKRPQLLKKIRDFSGLDDARYKDFCEKLLENLVHYCQKLPQTTTSYYSQPGGLVDHALNRTEAALSLFHDFMLLDKPDTLSEEQKLWQYALYSAAILQSIGTLFVDYQVQIFDTKGQLIKQWNPLLESLIQAGERYDYELLSESDIEFRHRLNLLLAKAMMPSGGFAWIASNAQVLAVWLALLNEDYSSAGTLGAILIRADALAIQRYLNEFIGKKGLKRSSFRTGTFNDGAAETLLDKEQAIGMEFLQWLTDAMEKGEIQIIMVSGGLILPQELFQMFVKQSKYQSWIAVQNGFLALGLYVLDAEGKAILRFENAQTKAMVSGVLFSKYAVALPATVKTKSGESLSALEFIQKVEHTKQYTKELKVHVPPLQKLSAAGQWKTIAQGADETLSFQPGAKIRG